MDAISEEDLQAAEARARQRRADGPYAVSAHYDRRVSRVVIMLSTGVELGFPPRLAEGLSEARPDDLAEIEVTPSGLGLHFPRLDADLYVPAVISGIMGSQGWTAKQSGSKGGASTSAAKSTAARENGKKGGRPRILTKSASQAVPGLLAATKNDKKSHTRKPAAATKKKPATW